MLHKKYIGTAKIKKTSNRWVSALGLRLFCTDPPECTISRPKPNQTSKVGWSVMSQGGIPDSKVHGANMGPTWILSAPGGPHVGPMNLAIGDHEGTSHITGPLSGLALDSPHKGPGLQIFSFLLLLAWISYWTVKLSVIWEAMMLFDMIVVVLKKYYMTISKCQNAIW